MTVGALIQLEFGNTDRMAFLTLNPQITHFKSVYKKYTNFSTQFITNQPILTDGILSFDQDTKITFEIPRDGDCIRDIYLTLELPDIYSDSNYQFQWIKRVGEYIIRDVSLQIDTNQVVDRQYGEWFHAYSELYYDEGKKKGYYKMIGNMPELYDPANAPGNNGIYPNTGFAPSIINRKLYVPLLFWFNKFASMSFPLIAIQKTVMSITFTFRRLQELYTVIDYSGVLGGSGKRVKPSKANHYIGNFLNPQQPNKSSLFVNPRLEINNVFLDNEERKRFAISTHEYLITQVQLIKNSYNTSASVPVDLTNINKPVTQLIWMIRRSDMEDINDWSNYTNWNVTDIPPYSPGYINPYGNPLTINSGNIIYYKNKNLLKSAVLRLLANEITIGDVTNNDNPTGSRLNGKDFLFYNLMENFYSNKNIPAEGIYTYSFSIDNSSLQPTGAVNFSSINNKDILLNLTPINNNETMNNPNGTPYTYNYIVYVFAVNYDIFKIMGGMASTMTVN
jgi:hypothetical protein